MSILRRCCLLVLLSCVNSGCLVSHNHSRIVRPSEPRVPVQFESQYAAESFHPLATNDSARKGAGTESSLAVPFLLGISYASEPSVNAFYNDQVAKCDVNADGLITDQEATEFAARTAAR